VSGVGDDTRLMEISAWTRCLLLDFDGPVCSVFAGRPAAVVAAELRDSLLLNGVDLSHEARETDDPMVVLHQAGLESNDAARKAQDMLAAAEVSAIDTAVPTPGALEVLRACRATNRRVAIVSNNTAPAVITYLRRHAIADYVSHVVGRDPSDLSLMKPHPFMLIRAAELLACEPERVLMVGDAPTDVRAARAAGMTVVGYGNKPHKVQTLADADVVVTDMHALAYALRTARDGGAGESADRQQTG
jgi:phosphoglycolate phosphatase